MSEMDESTHHRMTTLGGPVGRLGVAALALGGLSAALVGVGTAGASIHSAKNVVVSTAKSAKSGTILVSGDTLYTLKPSKAACTATCLKIWPALVLPKGQSKATAGSGVSASKLGTMTRSGGVRQVSTAT
jgi:predicted lipoprotein with Yx(FWY)xxD motif